MNEGKIYLTGDTHIPIDISKLSRKKFKEQLTMTKDDYLIVLGDFGLIWQNEPDGEERYWTKVLDNKRFTTLFIDGNHENHRRLNAYPVEEWHGGKVHRISDSIIHLMRGQVFNLHGKRFFTLGGAASVDKIYRTENISWWPEENCSPLDVQAAFDNLERHHNQVDYVLTHTCPAEIITPMFGINSKFEDRTANFLNVIADAVEYESWYFGHWHENKEYGKFTCLYDEIRRIL